MITRFATAGVCSRLTYQLFSKFITHKFYYGQGGELVLNLTNRAYEINIETIWEDYCQLQITGLKGIKNFNLFEEQGKANFCDFDLEQQVSQKIQVKLSIPEDFTIGGVVNGDVAHKEGQVGRKMRANPFSLKILGEGHSLSLGDVNTEKIEIVNQRGSASFSGLTVQEGVISAGKIEGKKVLTSNSLHLQADIINLRSLIMFGKSKGFLKGQQAKIESISGYSQIQCQNIGIDRYYGGPNDIHIKCKQIVGKIGVETGSGAIVFGSEEEARKNYERLKFGFMHKGQALLQGSTIKIV